MWAYQIDVQFMVIRLFEALGLASAPLPIPWSVLSQFAAGPTLSRADALLAHDTLAPAAAPARLENPTTMENP